MFMDNIINKLKMLSQSVQDNIQNVRSKQQVLFTGSALTSGVMVKPNVGNVLARN